MGVGLLDSGANLGREVLEYPIPHPPKRTGPKPSISWRGFLYASLGLSLIFGALDRTTTELAGLGSDRRDARNWRVSHHRRGHSPRDVTESVGEHCIPE